MPLMISSKGILLRVTGIVTKSSSLRQIRTVTKGSKMSDEEKTKVERMARKLFKIPPKSQIPFEDCTEQINIPTREEVAKMMSLKGKTWDFKDVTDPEALKENPDVREFEITVKGQAQSMRIFGRPDDGRVSAEEAIASMVAGLKNTYDSRLKQQPKKEEDGFIRKLFARYFKPKE